MTLSLPLAVATLWGCGGGGSADLSRSPEGRLCQRAYRSTIHSLTDLFEARGAKLPESWPSEDMYLQKCVGLGFSVAQLECLDPERSSRDPEGCKATMEPALDASMALSRWFTDDVEAQISAIADKETEEGGE